MSTPSTAETDTDDGIPAWMKTMEDTLDEETFYNARSSNTSDDPHPQENASSSKPQANSNSTSNPPDSSAPTESSEEVNAEDSTMSLNQKLSMATGHPSDLSDPDPGLQPEVVGYVRADLNKQLEEAVSVLKTRYSDQFSKSLFLDVALRQILIDLHTHGDESMLVLWIDSILLD